MRVCKETMRRRLHVMADATCSVEGYEIYETACILQTDEYLPLLETKDEGGKSSEGSDFPTMQLILLRVVGSCS